jgi:SAM-dependent methyltransferase
MHQAPLNFVKRILATSVPRGPLRLLEIGSYDVNGSIRDVVKQSEVGPWLRQYVGADLTAGPGVDVVISGNEISYESSSFDIVMSLECFEHNPFWKETLTNMIRMLKPGGLCIVTCASLGRPEHGTPRMEASSSPGTRDVGWNYYHNISLSEFRAQLSNSNAFTSVVLAYGAAWNDLYFVGLKGGTDSNLGVAADFERSWRAASVCAEQPSQKRRLTHLLERVLGGQIFQAFYVLVWRALKPR